MQVQMPGLARLFHTPSVCRYGGKVRLATGQGSLLRTIGIARVSCSSCFAIPMFSRFFALPPSLVIIVPPSSRRGGS